MNLRTLLDYSSSGLRYVARYIKRLNSSIMSLYLLLKSSLSLMALGCNIVWGRIQASLRARISLSKFVIHWSNLSILCWVRHYRPVSLWAKLLANVQTMFNYGASIGFLITNHDVGLCTIRSFTSRVPSFSYILKFSLIPSCVVDSSIRFLILSIPVISGHPHDIFCIVDASYCLRLPFLIHLLTTSILNVSWRKLNCVLVPLWVSPHRIRVDCRRCIGPLRIWILNWHN
jgi:hypothetical protein